MTMWYPMIGEDLMKQAAKWAAEEFERRTLLIAQDDPSVNVYWLHSSSRVSWHEIAGWLTDHGAARNQQGGLANVVDIRLAMQPLFNKEIKKRKLWRVLQGKEKSDEWAIRTGKMKAQ